MSKFLYVIGFTSLLILNSTLLVLSIDLFRCARLTCYLGELKHNMLASMHDVVAQYLGSMTTPN